MSELSDEVVAAVNPRGFPVYAVVGGPRSGCSTISRLLAQVIGGVVDTEVVVHPALRGLAQEDRVYYWLLIGRILHETADVPLVIDNPILLQNEGQALLQAAWRARRPMVHVVWLGFEMSMAFDRMADDNPLALFQGWDDFEEMVLPQLWRLQASGNATLVEARLLSPGQIVADALTHLSGMPGEEEPSGS